MTQKHVIIALSIALALSLAVASIMLNANAKTIHSKDQVIGEKNSEIITWTNKAGKLIAEKQAAEIRVQELEKYPDIVKTITKDFEQKLKRTRAFTQTSFEARGSGQAKIIPFDSTNTIDLTSNYTFDVSNSSLHLKYQTRDDGSKYFVSKMCETCLDTVEVYLEPDFQGFGLIAQDGYLDFRADVNNEFDAPYEYFYSDTVKTLFTMKGKLFQKKQLYVQSMLSNPNAKVINSTAILVNEAKDKRWGIGPYIGVGVGPDLKPQTNVGASVHYSLIRF